MIYRTKNGEKLYPVCSWEKNQHKLYNAEDKAMIFWYEAVENGSAEDVEKAEKCRERIEKALSAFGKYVINGIVYATYPDRNLILDYVWAYDARR